MDVMTILSLASAASNIIGSHFQGKSERERYRIATERANKQIGWQNQELGWQREQMGWQKDDLGRQKDAAVGSLLTQSAALGIGGPSVSAAKEYTIGEYNRALSQMDKQIGWNRQQENWNRQQSGWNNDDMDLFNDQSRFNQSVGIGSSLLTMGTSLYGNSENKKYKSLYEDAKKNYSNTIKSGGLGT